MVTVGGKKLKLALWDTAGQERFRTLTSSYYRGVHGIIMVYDVTRRDTFTNLSDIWTKEIELYSTNQDCIKMLVGNKVDKLNARAVTKKSGIDFAREYGCLFLECSAKTRSNVERCFEELVLKILETPSLLGEGSTGLNKSILSQRQEKTDSSSLLLSSGLMVLANITKYGLPKPLSLMRSDNNLPPWRPGLKEIFDAIVCDPPYGVRAGGRKSGGRKLLKGTVDPYTVPEEKRFDHIPSTAAYSLAECMSDLLELAARMLVMGGRLVFFFPVLREDAVTVAQFPEHPCFTLIASCEQILSLRYSRYLLTMVKTGHYTEEISELARKKHLEFRENHLKWMEEGNLHSAVFSSSDSETAKSKFDRDSKPKYRGKYV